MFGFRKKDPTIDVEFYEQGSLKASARSSQPITQLPDTFEIDTTLSIQGEEWHVTSAQPATKEEFRKTGRVQIYLCKPKIGQVPVDNILYSLPTINDSVAALEESSSLEDVFVVHEDDWRQQEFVSRQHIESVLAELESVREIHKSERVGLGFKKIHVRSTIPEPLQGASLTLSELMTRLDSAHQFRGVAFNRYAAIIRHGFAFRSKLGFVAWGQSDEKGMVTTLCVQLPDGISLQNEPVDRLLADHKLLFVNWLNLVVIPPVSG